MKHDCDSGMFAERSLEAHIADRSASGSAAVDSYLEGSGGRMRVVVCQGSVCVGGFALSCRLDVRRDGHVVK